MTAELDSLILEHLRAIRSDLAEVKEDVRNIKIRMTNVEEQIGYLHTAVAGVNRRLDQHEDRLARIEKRVGLVDNSLYEAATPFEGPQKGPKK